MSSTAPDHRHECPSALELRRQRRLDRFSQLVANRAPHPSANLPHPHHQQPPTVAILGANTLLDRILARLLEDEGYDTRLLEPYPTGFRNELPHNVDVLLLSPYLDADLRWAFLNTVKGNPRAAQRIPVVSLSFPLQVALQDELAINVSWQSLFEGLVQEIEATLGRAEETAELLPPLMVDTG